MGTRADFYVGKGVKAKWLGSIGYDGYPEGLSLKVLKSKTSKDFEKNVLDFLTSRDDSTAPSQGWPWPWDNSQTTDYAYLFYRGQVYISLFGRALKSYDKLVIHNKKVKALEKQMNKTKDEDLKNKISQKIEKMEDTFWPDGKVVKFPDMTDKKHVALDQRSGMIVLKI